MVYVIIFLGLLFGGIGLILTESNARSLLTGYNTMSEEERRGFNIKGYVPFFRRFHLWLGLSFLVGGCGLYYLVDVDAAGIFLGVYPILAYIYFLWASKRFSDPAATSSVPATRTSFGTGYKAGMWILVGSLIFVLGLMALGYQEDRLTVEPGGREINAVGAGSNFSQDGGHASDRASLRISGMYGETISLSEIQSFALIDTLPKITFRENGFAMGRISKGYFRTADKERVKLILNTKTPPYILITKTNGRKIYYSARNASILEQYQHIKSFF